jgi:4-amino-4-deoxy-L-arabinose transferase-like glycosyltransferase
MDFEALTDRIGGLQLALESIAAFGVALAFLCLLAPAAPFTKELGVCESGAVRDVLAGNVILPQYSPGALVQVPPMYWWAAATAVRIFGWNEIALRAPSIFAAAMTTAILYAWLASGLSRRVAMWSVPVLLSTQYIADAARQPRMDAILMMFLTAAMVCLERGLAREPKRKVPLLACAALSMGGAMLTKGPLGLLLPGLALAVFLALQRRLRELFILEVIATFAIALAIGATWYLAALDVGGHVFFEWQIVHGLFRRFFGAAAGGVGECQNPFYYFIPRLVSGFLPWSLFYPALAVMMWNERANIPPMLFALCWFATILGFFTISAGKCAVYILPLFPALAALIACVIANAAARSRSPDLDRKLFDWASIAIAAGVVVMVVALLALLWSGSAAAFGLEKTSKQFLEVLIDATARGSAGVILWMFLSIAGAIVALTATARHQPFRQSCGVALIALAGTLFWYGFLNPALGEHRTLKSWTEVVDRTVPAGLPIDYIGPLDCDFAFYSDHEIGAINNFRCGAESRDAYFLVWKDRLVKMTPDQLGCLAPLSQSTPVDRHGARVLMLEKK